MAGRRRWPRPRTRAAGTSPASVRRPRRRGWFRSASWPSVARVAAIDDEHRAGDPLRLLGGEERHGGRDLPRLALPRDGLELLDEPERLVVRAGLHALGLRQS